MLGRSLGAFLGTLVWLSVSAEPTALAQTVPLPTPAPQSKTVAKPAASAPKPPAATDISKANPVIPGQPSIRKFVGPGETLALDANQRSLVDRISLYLSTINTLVGDFVQVGPNGNRTEGQFYIQKPGRVRFEYEPPNPIEVIADGRSVVVQNRQLATKDFYPLAQTPLRFLLAERLDLMRDTTLVGLYADDTFVTIVIEERQQLVGTSRLMMMFAAKDLQLRQWTVTDPQGYDTTVAVYNLDTTTKPNPTMFTIDYASNNNNNDK
jgi:outer membrane lipoprotein-sorting protein